MKKAAYYGTDGSICFFNKVEAVCNFEIEEPEELEAKPEKKKYAQAKKEDISGFPVNVISHYMFEEELIVEFGENGCK